MTRPDPHEERLRALLADAVDDVDPAPALAAIRARTQEVPMSTRRTRALTVGAAIVATAAIVTTIAWAGGVFDRGATPPVAEPVPSPTVLDPTDEPEPTTDPEPELTTYTVAVYWVGDTPKGPRLYREFQRARGTSKPLAAVTAAMAGTPDDPDYRNPWPGSAAVESVSLDGSGSDGQINVVLADGGLRDRPSDLSAEEAAIAVEQVIYTAQAALEARAPVQFSAGGNPIDQVLGVPTSEPLSQGDFFDVLSLVSLSDPAEGTVVDDGILEVRGVGSSFEATVPWEIRRDGEQLESGFLTLEGDWMSRLVPFAGGFDVSGLAPGRYEFRVSTDDPSDGEGPGPDVDTRTFVVE